MARKGQLKPIPGDATDPEGFSRRLTDYLEWMAVKNLSPWTIRRRRTTLCSFFEWCEDRSLKRPSEITRPILERYTRWLFYYRTKTGGPLSFRSQCNRLTVVRLFFKYLTRRNLLLWNPASDLELPKVGHRLPRVILSISEMEQVLNQPDLSTDLGIRDRAILETLYSTGMRRMELTNLDVYDLNIAHGTVLIREGKGKKDRVVPIGERALDWIDRYMTDVRPGLLVSHENVSLFLTGYGDRLSNDGLSARVSRYVKSAEIGKLGSCHLFRHTMATLMLQSGADLRSIQHILGHAKLDTTQLYTQVAIVQLKRVHAMTHPSAKRGRRVSLDEESPENGSGALLEGLTVEAEADAEPEA